MNGAAKYFSREFRKLRERCWQRKTLFQHRGVVRADLAVQACPRNRTDQSVEAQ
jgi:hypothetical protein